MHFIIEIYIFNIMSFGQNCDRKRKGGLMVVGNEQERKTMTTLWPLRMQSVLVPQLMLGWVK
jgi:hypothetical protein